MNQALLVGRPWRVILAFAVPLLLGNVVQQLYQATDAVVVGRTLGVDALAAVGATGSLVFLLLGFTWGMSSGFGIPTARAFGAGDLDGVRRSVATGAILTGCAAVLVTSLALVLTRPALELLRTPDELVPQATTFATVAFSGAVATMYFNFLSSTIKALGNSRTPMVFLAICCGLNVVLVVAFVRGLGTGVGGASLATVLSQAMSVVLCLVFVKRRMPVLHLRRSDLRLHREETRTLLRLGLPMGFQFSIIAIGTLAVQLRLNELGSDAVAAYTTAARVDALALTLLASLGLSVSTFVAQNYGAGLHGRIRQGVRESLVMSFVGSVAIGVVLVAAGSHIVGLFVGPGEGRVVGMAAHMLVVNGSLYSILGVLFVTRAALQGLGNAFVPTVTGVIELGMRVGASIVLGAAFGYVGVIWGNPLAWVGAAVVLVPAFLRAQRALGADRVVAGQVSVDAGRPRRVPA